MPPRVRPDQTRGKPRFHAALRDRYGTDRLSERDWAEIARTYYGMISRVDDQLGRVMRAVERAGAAERTAWFFFTDHGEYLGDYGLVEKWPSGLERCLLQNPLIVAVPGARSGQVASSFVETVDLLPTLLELAGTRAQHTHFGRSFLPLLHDPRAAHRDAAFAEGGFHVRDVDLFEASLQGFYRNKTSLQRERPELLGKAIVMRTERHICVHRLFEGDELYDRAADPHEARNLLGEEGAEGLAREYRDRILEWLLATSDVIPWEPDPRFPKIPHGWHDRVGSPSRVGPCAERDLGHVPASRGWAASLLRIPSGSSGGGPKQENQPASRKSLATFPLAEGTSEVSFGGIPVTRAELSRRRCSAALGLAAGLLLACAAPLTARADESALPPAPSRDPEFSRFCNTWMHKLAQRERDNAANLKMVRRAGGFVGEWVGYAKTPVRCIAKATGRRENPFVGRLVYHEIRYRQAGPTPEAARSGQAAEIARTEVMEIFRFDGQRWVY
jgi:hypothetical protein